MNAQTKIPDLSELIVIDDADALTTFTDKARLEPILAKVRAHIDAFEGDASTPTGRKQIASMAFAVTKSKTALEAIGERLAQEAKALPKKIDAGRKHVKDTLDAWRDEVRKPLTDWEAAEEARVARHTADLEALKAIALEPAGDAAQIRAQIALVETISDGADREEFADGFRLAKASALEALRKNLAWREKYDAEQVELAALRALNAAREAEEVERKRVAAEAEAKAEAERTAAEAIARAAEEAVERERAAAEQQRIVAERKAQAEREAAEKREADLKAQAAAAEQRARDAEAKAQAELKAKADAEATALAKREADKEHRRRINRAALDALINVGITDVQAMAVLTAIITGEVPNVRVNY